MLNNLPSTLKSDISFHQYGKLIEGAYFLNYLYMEEQETVWSLVKYLTKVRLDANITIYKKNEIADAMYIIHSGKVNLFVEI